MTHQSSLSTRTNSCIPTRITDSCCHRDLDPRCHNKFDPRHDGLELNIQLPDFDVNIPPCPACPACPPCPSYPQPKPDTGTKPKTKEPEPFNIEKLAISTLPGTDKIINVKTGKETGLSSQECGRIIDNTENNLRILDGKIVGKCYDNSKCDECVEALNSSIVMVLATDHSIPTLEGTVYIL